jgi:predicted dehydrogenase
MIETFDSNLVVEKPLRRPRLGFAGVGWIGRNRLEAIARSDLAEIVAVTDPTIEAGHKAIELAPGAMQVGGYEELLRQELDGIVIATPSALHAAQATAALERGIAVFCQKPLARTGAETRGVIDAARAADRLLGADLSYRFTEGMQRIQKLIQDGALGRVYAVEAVFHNAYGPDKPWFYDAKQAGGGCLLDLGIHLVDLAFWALGNPEVSAVAGNLASGGAPWDLARAGVEDYAAALIQLQTGTSIQLACSWKVPAGCDAMIGLTFFGTKGGASFRNVDGSFYDFVAEHFLPDRSRVRLAGPPDAWGGRAAVEWTRRLAISPAFDPEIERLAGVAQTLDNIYGRGTST